MKHQLLLIFDHKKKKSLQINVHINHPDSVFTLVSKDVGCEAFVLLEKQLKCEAFMSLHSLYEQSVWRCNYFLKINPKVFMILFQ